jgi:putative ABC transport system permease protein
MFRNYLMVAIRSLSRNRIYSLINVCGLALGIGCSLVIMLYVMDELSYDRHHTNVDRIHRVILDAQLMGKEIQGAVSPAPMAQAVIEEIPDVENAVRMWRRNDVLIGREDRKFNEYVYYADASYFSIFTHPLIEGDPATALVEPNSIVLTRSGASKIFGDEPALGKSIKLNSDDFVVTGIAEDVPHSAHVHFDYLASLVTRKDSRDQMWVSNNYFTYLHLNEGVRVSDIEAKLNAMVRKYAGPQIKSILKVTLEEFEKNGGRYVFHLQPLTDVHLRSHFDYELEPNGDILYVYMFSSIALLVIVVACINYTNLTTARASKRSIEIGMRKAVGAYRGQLVGQFLGESVLLTIVAFVLGIASTYLLLPTLSAQLDKPLSFASFSSWHIVSAVIATLVVGVGAGAYPALLLSRFRPQVVLKGASGLSTRGTLRSVLVVFQFVVSVVLVVGTVVVSDQLGYIQNKHLGFDKDRLVVVQRAWPVRKQLDAFKEELLRDPRILAVGGASNVPGKWFSNSAYLPEGMTGEQSRLLWRLSVDNDFVGTMGMTMVEGRSFSREFASDSTAALLNQKAVESLGWQGQAVGKQIGQPRRAGEEPLMYTVVGVVSDFHFESMREEIRPVIIQHVAHSKTENVSRVLIRLQTDDYVGVIEKIKQTWKGLAPDHPFVYSFLNDNLDNLYRADQKTAGVAGGFSALAIAIGCLGLFGLTSFMAEQRTKEIGVRKALGASVSGVVRMLSQDIVKLVIVGTVIAWPIAYYLMDAWLQDFVYRMTLGPVPFLMGGCLALLVALGTVSFQTFRAARRDPVDALRCE